MSNNDQDIFSERDLKALFDEYFKPIKNFIYFKVGNTAMAEDLAQDAFVKLWKSREGIKKSTVKSYLYTIANNLTINHLKRNQLRYKFENQYESRSQTETPEFKMIMKEYEERLNEVLASIPDGSREVFLMNRIEGLKYREIAERLDLSVKAIEKRMSKAIQIIFDQLGVRV